ncbi:hypothetical protein TNCV_2212261 [Trichonephila clavipes]|nr:hypothetical protein TNCV_2212261 [Trichonephila clavipes]
MLYALPIWAAAAVTHLKRLHTFQNIQLRRAANAPWFVRNEVLHKDLNVPPLFDFIKNNQKISSTVYHRFQMNLSGKSRLRQFYSSSSKRPRAVLNPLVSTLPSPEKDENVFIRIKNYELYCYSSCFLLQDFTRSNYPPPTPFRSNSWNAQLAIPNDPRYARLETNLGIWKAKEGQ